MATVLKTQSNILFPRELSDRIISAMFTERGWEEKERLLNEIVARVVGYGYERIPGIRKRLDDARVNPEQITDFQSYERLVPPITILEMSRMGQEQFEPQLKDTLTYQNPDLEILAEQVFIEELKKKEKGVIKAGVTRADMRAAYLAITARLSKESVLPSKIFVNQKPSDGIEEIFLRHVIIPAFESLGIEARRIHSPDDISKISDRENIGLLFPGAKIQAVDIKDAALFRRVISVGGIYDHQFITHIGNYHSDKAQAAIILPAMIPLMGYDTPFPFLMRIVDADGRLFRAKSCQPDTGQRGKVVIDKFFSAYELPTPWALLRTGLLQIRELEPKEITFYNLESLLEKMQGSFIKAEFSRLRESIGIDKYDTVTLQNFQRLYAAVMQKYFSTSVRIGMPSSTWLLNVQFPIASQISNNGLITNILPLSNVDLSHSYIVGNEFDVKYSPEATPYTSQNIIGIDSFPELRPSIIMKRVTDTLNGRNLLGQGKNGYIMTASIVSPGDFRSMLGASNRYSKQIPLQRTTLEDILEILDKLHFSVEAELQKTYQGKPSMISVFAENTRIPVSEIEDMLRRAKADFIENGALGIKRIAYAAFINSGFDPSETSTETLKRGIEALSKQKPRSPVFMVTPGNITLYDSFYIFAQILMAKLTDQSEGNFTMYVRPSESDITLNFLFYKFHQISTELDPENKKGLRILFQKAYWDPRYDEDFLKIAMSNAKTGIYYGTAKTYMEARFLAALDIASKTYNPAEINKLKEIAEKEKGLEYKVAVLDTALQQGVDKRLIRDIREFMSMHTIYPETLNAIVVLPDKKDIGSCANRILEQVISTRSTDCTNAKKVWIPRSAYEEFIKYLKEGAEKLTYGDIMNTKTRLAQYDIDLLKINHGLIKSRKDTIVILPVNVESGSRAKEPINPIENYTGVIVSSIDINSLLEGNPVDRDTNAEHLSQEIPLPWLNIIVYDNVEQVIASMDAIRQKYEKRTGYPRYLYVAAMSNNDVASFEQMITTKGMTDLFKKGEEAYKQFLYYRSHQGSFFIKELVQ